MFEHQGAEAAGEERGYVVFRATGTTASLEISDWLKAEEPGAPVGEELYFDFIQVQPYFAGETNSSSE